MQLPNPYLDLAVIDVETTGMSAASDRVVEVFVQRLLVDARGRFVDFGDSYHSLHDPGRRIPWDATAVHGITNAMVRGHAIDDARLAEVTGGADLVIAHNSGFDKGFVRQHAPMCDDWLWGCSCRGIGWRALYPGLYSAALQEIARYLRLPVSGAHRARADVETTCRVLLHQGPDGEPHVTQLLGKKPGRRLKALQQQEVTGDA